MLKNKNTFCRQNNENKNDIAQNMTFKLTQKTTTTNYQETLP